VVVGYVGTLSVLVLCLQCLLRTKTITSLRHKFGLGKKALNADYVPEGDYVARHGGATILSFQAVRCVTNTALTGTLTATAVSDRSIGSIVNATAAVSSIIVASDVVAHIAQAYATLLSLALLVHPISQGRCFAAHATVASFPIFLCIFYRNMWPLMTVALSPGDGQDTLAWASLVLACIAGVIVPICEPYPYIPYDPASPQARPSPEQTASLLSLVSYSFLDSIIFASTRARPLSVDVLPSQLDTDDIEALKPRAYRLLDPFRNAESHSGSPQRIHMLRGLLATFWHSWVLQALLYALGPALRLGQPIGTNRLLAYLETHGAGTLVRPWVWIAWIALAPLVTEVVAQLNQWIGTRVCVQVEAIISALVYDHALRVRVVRQTDASSVTGISQTKGGPSTKTKDVVGRLSNLVTSGQRSRKLLREFRLRLFDRSRKYLGWQGLHRSFGGDPTSL
jgi:hypothetical protein